MTYDEYMKLYEEWSNTDSISHKEEIEEKISEAAKELLKLLCGVHARYGKSFVKDNDDRGGPWFQRCDVECVHFCYSDKWAYGGECMFGINVPMKYLDVEERKSLEGRLRSSRMTQLSNMIEGKRRHLSSVQDEIAKYEEELKRLKSN